MLRKLRHQVPICIVLLYSDTKDKLGPKTQHLCPSVVLTLKPTACAESKPARAASEACLDAELLQLLHWQSIFAFSGTAVFTAVDDEGRKTDVVKVLAASPKS